MNWFIHEVIGAVIGIAVSSLFRFDWRDACRFIISQTVYRNKRIRLSISYLFRIKIDGKYLLVKGKRIEHQYQPVGGVFKRLPESVAFFNKLDIRDDDNIPIDLASKNDLRINLEGKYLCSFLRWYRKGEGRENSVFREFYEELIAPGYLPAKVFPYINYRYIRQIITKINFAQHFQMHEILIAEIYEFIPNQEQMIKLQEIINNLNENYIWVDEETIKRRGANQNIVISPTGEWIL